MANLITNGMAKLQVAVLAGDGGIGTVWEDFGYVAEESASFTQDDPETTEFFAEQVDDAIFSSTKQGKRQLNFILTAPDEDTFVDTMGGTITGTGDAKQWAAPDQVPVIERSFRVIPTTGLVIWIARASLAAKVDGGLSKTSLLGISVVATLLAPTKVGQKAWGTQTIASTED